MSRFGSLQPVIDAVAGALPADTSIWLVGGAVRDLLLGGSTHDLDFVVSRGGIAIGRRIADRLGGDFYPLDTQRDTGRVILNSDSGRLMLDFTAFRGPDLTADLLDRDFTINAIAIDLYNSDTLVDPTGGAADLRGRIIRACSPISFEHDPVRVLRAVRQSVQLGFRIDPQTVRWLRGAVPQLALASRERVRDEIFKILEGAHPAAALRLLHHFGAASPVFPGLTQSNTPSKPFLAEAWEVGVTTTAKLTELLDVLKPSPDPEGAGTWALGMVSIRLGRYRNQRAEHLKTVLNINRSIRSLLLFSGLYIQAGRASLDQDWSEIAHPESVTAAEMIHRSGLALRLTNTEVDRAEKTILGCGWIEAMNIGEEGLSRRQVYRYFRETGQAGVDACLVSLAQTLAVYGAELPQDVWIRRLDTARTLLEAWWEARSERVDPAPLLTGHELMQTFELAPGPKIGRLLEEIREAQAAGEVDGRAAAFDLARELINHRPSFWAK